MAPGWPKRGHDGRTGGVARNAIKGTLFSQFRHPGGSHQAKMEAKWGRYQAKRHDLEVQIGGKARRDEAKSAPARAPEAVNAEARRGQVGAKTKRSWSQDGPKMAQERPRYANRRGGNKCNKRYPFFKISVPSGAR